MRHFSSDSGHWAKYRAHGDPFPIAPGWLGHHSELNGLPFPQRGLWSAKALNNLALHDANLDFDSILQGIPPNQVQIEAAKHVVHCLREAGSPPEGMDGKSVLRDMGISNDLYSEEPANLATYSFDKVKVLQSKLKPRPLLSVLPKNSQSLLSRAENFIIKNVEERKMEPCEVTPYWDPRLKHSKSELNRLIVGLANQGLITFRSHIRERVGIFFVKKKTPE